ncbi:MAG: glycerophosphodiester phosphodiesterase family protein [Lentisphaeria bacterium]|jgi:glycerophosphoryl diester phosphodiesterase|nr:glycerophosphodiester phosphodiesterase family protein [Lentisphaeria bacterium]
MAETKWQIHAHRGGRDEFDENTLAAFQASYDRGLRGFETDIHMCRDGALVIIHDSSLERTTCGTGDVEDQTEAELRQVVTKQGNPILFLDELIDFLADKPGLYFEFEMKTDPERYPPEKLAVYCRNVYEAIAPRTPADSTYVFSSFDKRALRQMRETAPEADLMLITGSPCCEATIKEAQELGVKRLACTWDKSTRAAVRAAHEAGLVVAGWPGRTVRDYLLGVALGFDHMCADNPVEVLDFKERHLPWLDSWK